MPSLTRAYVQPITTAGAAVTPESPHGVYTLTALTTYYYIIGPTDAVNLSITLTGETAALVITSATIQDTDHPVQDVTDFDATAGRWLDEDPTTAFVAVDGTGWSASNGVVAVTGGNLGGARWNLGEDAAHRTRLAVVVGATGGTLRVSKHGKGI